MINCRLGHRGPVICSRFAPSNRAVLATGGEDGTVRLWHFGSVLKDSGVQGVHEVSVVFFIFKIELFG